LERFGFIPNNPNVVAVIFPGSLKSLGFALRHKGFPLIKFKTGNGSFRPIPNWYLMAPPKLARHAPWLNIFEPVKVRLFPIFGYKYRPTYAHGF
jgi:hypothetical protein